MNLKLDVVKNADGTHVMHVEVSVVGQGFGRFVVPLGSDLLYAIYKGINLELAHLDCVLSEAGVKAKAEEEAKSLAEKEFIRAQEEFIKAQEAQRGSKEQAQDVGECTITEAADSIRA